MKSLLIRASAGLLLLGLTGGARADLTVAEYVDLAQVRLEQALTTWSEQGRAPNEVEEAMLWVLYGTSAEEFYGFMGANKPAVEGYLAAHADTRGRIEDLSEQVRQAIANRGDTR
jgi:hypothetical protein